MNGLQSYDTDHDPNPNNVFLCEALSEPRRLVELDNSDLVGDDDIRCYYERSCGVLCCVVLCCVVLCCVVS